MNKEAFSDFKFYSGMTFLANGQWRQLQGVDFDVEDFYDEDNIDYRVEDVIEIKDRDGSTVYSEDKSVIVERVKALFQKYDHETGKFELVEKKRSNRPDVHAFIILDESLYGYECIISQAKDNAIILDISIKSVASLSEDRIIELIRCGVGLYGHNLCIYL